MPEPVTPQWLFYRGRVALTAILRGLGIGPGDEVATQAYTCVAVAEGVMATGAMPLWIDIDPNGYSMNPSSLASRIGPQTRAVIVQHTFGIPAQLADLVHIAEQHGIPVIEDCCHTLASTYRGRPVGTYGVAAFNSFEWGKPIAAGLGGGAYANDRELEAVLDGISAGFRNPPFSRTLRIESQYLAYRLLYRPRHYWQVKSSFQRLGRLGLAESNYHPVNAAEISDEFTFAMAAGARRRLGRRLTHEALGIRRRRQVVALYRQHILTEGVTHPVLPENEIIDLARYPLSVAGKDDLLRLAQDQGIELADWYRTPIHPLGEREAMAVGYQAGQCPAAEKRCLDVVSLPTNSSVGLSDIRRAARFLDDNL